METILKHFVVIENGVERSLFNARRKATLGALIHFLSAIYSMKPELWSDWETCWQLIHDMNVEPQHRQFGVYDDVKRSASYSGLVGREGQFIETAPIEARTWHAGKSVMNGMSKCNNFALGYAVIAAPFKAKRRDGSYDEELLKIYGYTDAQYRTMANVVARGMHLYGFSVMWVKGHDQVRADYNSGVPSNKQAKPKPDPGITWDWDKFRLLIIKWFEDRGNTHQHDLDGG